MSVIHLEHVKHNITTSASIVHIVTSMHNIYNNVVNLSTQIIQNQLYPIQNGRPTLHGNTLKDSEHSESDVVERCDAKIWSLPVFQTRGQILVAKSSRTRAGHWQGIVRVAGARCRVFAIVHHHVQVLQTVACLV